MAHNQLEGSSNNGPWSHICPETWGEYFSFKITNLSGRMYLQPLDPFDNTITHTKRWTTTKTLDYLARSLESHILTINVVSLKLGCQSRNRRVHWQRSKSNRNSIRTSPSKLWRKASRRIGKSYLDITTSSRRHIFQSILQMSPNHQTAGGEVVDSAGSQERQGREWSRVFHIHTRS